MIFIQNSFHLENIREVENFIYAVM